ncbi:MAG: PAS domain S-box protein [Candidatus Omnitrophota bacterium]|jgi:PAS domain S-box-containing protein
MNIHRKALLLLVSLIALFFFVFMFLGVITKRRQAAISLAEKEEKVELVDKIIRLKGLSLETFANDYSYWGEMVHFVKTKDMEWARLNIQSGLSTYNANCAWVYDVDKSLVYDINTVGEDALRTLPLPQVALAKIFEKEKLCHFFINTAAGVLEIRGATIHPTEDFLRETPARGYFLVGRLWDQLYVDELEGLTGCEIEYGDRIVLSKLKGAKDAIDIVFTRDFRGWDGGTVVTLRFACISKTLKMFIRTSELDFLTFFIFMVLVLAATSVFVTRSVSLPLRLISDALRTKDTGCIDRMRVWNNEFGDVARLVYDFFEQQKRLLIEISGHKEAEETRRRSEEKYRDIFDNTGLGIFQSTPEGRYLHVNPAFAHMAGFASSAEMLSGVKNIRDLYADPNVRERLKMMLAKDNKISNFEVKIIRVDGGYSWILINAKTVRGLDGDILCYDGTVQDITERKDAEDEIRDWMRRYELIVEASGQVAYDYHVPTGSILWGNTLKKVLGYSTDELNGGFDQWIELLHPDDMVHTAEKLSKAKQSCSHWDEEYRLRHKNGKYVWIRDRGFFIPAKNGVANSQLGMIEDITERKNAEAAIQGAKDYLNTIINTIADPVFVKDSNHNFVLVNDAFCRFLGRSREELEGKSDYTFVPKEQADVFWTNDEIVFNTGNDNINEENITDAQGRVNAIVTKKSLYMDKNGNKFIVGIIRDITERKKIEESLRLAQLGELVSVMAHEINNPVMIISGNTQLLMMNEGINEEDKNNLKVIFEQCQRAKSIIQSLLSFSRPSKGVRKDVEMNSSIEGLLNLVEHQYTLDNIRFRRVYSNALPMVRVDEHQFHEVFMNLLSNAKEALKHGGEIEITTAVEGDFIRIDFKDSGPGMSQDVMRKMFEPFFTTKEKGTGLGLAICYGIVKAHDGVLKCQSSPGKGATFTILLPAVKSAPA